MENNTLCNRHSLGVNNHTKMYVTYTRIYGWSDYGGESSYQPGYRLENMMWMTLLVYDYIIPGDNSFSFVSTFFSVLGRIMINKAAFNILEYCDGDNSVQDICHLLNTKYDIDEDIIYKDVDKTLQLFWRLKVIKMTGENYLLDRFVYISDKLKIKYLQYEELLDLVSNIDSLKDSLVIAEEGLGLLNNENILKLVWSLYT